MNTNDTHSASGPSAGEPRPARRRPLALRLLKWAGVTVLSVVALLIAAICVGTWTLTPERLTRLVNSQASKALNADVRAGNVRFTLWSTFPHLCIEADSLDVRSRNFDSVPATLRRQLPDSADFLLGTGRLRGGINLLRLLHGTIALRDVEVNSMRVNLVAASQTLNNYDIVPGSDRSGIPYVTIDGMKLDGAGFIRYTSLASATRAGVALDGASLMPAGRKDTYHLALSGKVSARSDDLTILDGFPLRLDGNVNVRFKPFGISTDDYRIGLGHVSGCMSMDMDMGNQLKLNNFDYNMQDFTLQDLAGLLPPGDHPVLQRLDADLDLDLGARLTTPYDFASAYLPSIEVDCRVSDGKVGYTFSDNEKYTMRQVGLSGRFVFDGRHPDRSYIDVPDFHASGLGLDVDVAARVTQLTSRPLITARVRGKGDLTEAGRRIAALAPYRLGGELDLDAGVQFSVVDKNVYGTLLDIDAHSRDLAFGYGPCRIRLKGFEATSDERYADALSQGAILNDIPLRVKVTADDARIIDRRDSLDIHAGAVAVDARLGRTGHGAVMRSADIRLTGDEITVSTPQSSARLKDTKVNLLASRMNSPIRAPRFRAPASWSADAATMAFAPHTPEYLHVDVPDALRDIMAMWKTRLDVSVARTDIRDSRIPDRSRIEGLSLTASFDSLHVREFTFASGITRGSASVRVANLRQFLDSRTPAPLVVGLDVALDTVQINELARAYAESHPNSAIARGDTEAMAAGVDTVAMILPRNLYADVRATAMQTRYINLHLYDLMTRVRLADGRADVDTLHISSDFGQAALKFRYDTSDLQRMAMDADLRVYDIDVVRFFQNFPRLLDMMPAMKNLSGTISASLDGGVRLFPKMYAMVPSLHAVANVRGLDLKLHQNRFIRHVTRMLMIPGLDDLHIADIDIRAAVHHNLLEVFPFIFEVSGYRLSLCGLNNFNGNLYYHIGVEDWPLKLPFGVNIKGHYHDPVLRFGGKTWKDRNGAGITAGIQDYDSFNVVRELRRYGGEFIHTAATYRGE